MLLNLYHIVASVASISTCRVEGQVCVTGNGQWGVSPEHTTEEGFVELKANSVDSGYRQFSKATFKFSYCTIQMSQSHLQYCV